MIFNMSGGGAKAYAFINVTYPAGSTCTCTNGSKTLEAKNTSRQALFAVPYADAWTVTITDGTKTKSKTVNITTEGQSVSVTLSYELILFNGIDECASVSGGWQARALLFNDSGNYSAVAPTITKYTTSTKIALAGNPIWPSGVYVTKNKIDLTLYDTLEFSGYATIPNEYVYPRFVVFSDLTTPWATTAHPRGSIQNGTTHEAKTLDISNCNGKYYVGVALNATAEASNIVMSKMRLY